MINIFYRLHLADGRIVAIWWTQGQNNFSQGLYKMAYQLNKTITSTISDALASVNLIPTLNIDNLLVQAFEALEDDADIEDMLFEAFNQY